MENVPYHDVEFYSTTPPSIHHHHHHSSHHVNSRGWKDYAAGHQYQSNNNHLSAPAHSGSELESSFSINVTTGDSEMFIDDLIELAADGTNNDSSSVRSSSAASSVISTPSPVIVPSLAKASSVFQDERNLVRSAPPPQIYHSRLHEALTQPRLPTAPVKCHRCGNELTSRCLMQTCADDTRCRQCGRDLTAKCILAVCTVQQGSKVDQEDLKKPRRHHYSSPSN